jgi:hypothetical protein
MTAGRTSQATRRPRRSHLMHVRLTAHERTRWEDAARRLGLSLAELLRESVAWRLLVLERELDRESVR